MRPYYNGIAHAFHVIPALKKFAPTFAPRLFDFKTGTHRHVIDGKTNGLELQSIYHDLGVIVFNGASVEQVQRIGDLIGKVVELGPNLKRSYPDRIRSKVKTWRIRTEDWHVDQSHKIEEGFLATDALFEFSQSLVNRWATSALRHTKGDINSDTVSFREGQVQIKQMSSDSGIINQTVYGPRRLSIDAVIQATMDRVSPSIFLRILFYAVGTGRLVGESAVHLEFFSKRENNVQLSRDDLQRIWNASAFDHVQNFHPAKTISETLWALEHETWAPHDHAISGPETVAQATSGAEAEVEAKKAYIEGEARRKAEYKAKRKARRNAEAVANAEAEAGIKAERKARMEPIAKDKAEAKTKTGDEDAEAKDEAIETQANTKEVDEAFEIKADTKIGGDDPQIKTRD